MPYKNLPLGRAFLQIEEGPVVLVSSAYQGKEDVFCLSWLMPLGYDENDCDIALMTGEWNYTFRLMRQSEACVINIPTISLMSKAIMAGTVSGEDKDKFETIGFKKEKTSVTGAPIISGCAAYIECKVIDYIEKYSIVILRPVKAGIDPNESLNPKFHAKGNGRFLVDGLEKDYSEMMADRIPASAKEYKH